MDPNDTNTKPTDTPRIYVACLASYTNGKLWGRWLNANQDADDLQAEITEVLATSPEPGSEEHAIHDFEGWGAYRLSEYESIADVAKLAALIAEHGEPVTYFITNLGCSIEYAAEHFGEAYSGCWASVADYAEQLAEDTGMLQGLPEHLRCYFDFERFGRDLELGGDIWSYEAGREVYIFNSHI